VKERSGILARIDDAFNPIVVKELRQAVHGKFVAAVLIVLLVIQITAIGLIIISSDDISTRFDHGRNAFMILQSIMLGICLLFVPAYTAFRLGSERSDTNVDLFFITTIRPRAIISGKVFAALVITVLIFSACMPFMVFTYWLRGIDLPSIFVMLAFSFLVVVVAVHMATFIASIGANRVFKILIGVAALCLLLPIFVTTLSFSFSLLMTGVGSRLNSWTFWGPALATVLILFTMIGLLFFLSVALITPISANRAFAVRLYVMVAWLVGGATGAVISYVNKDNTAVIVWSILSGAIFFLGFLVAVSERESLGSRLLRKIPRTTPFRVPAFFLFSGGASGVAWCCLMCVLTLIWIRLWKMTGGRGDPHLRDAMAWVGALGLYGFGYAMTAVFLRTTFLARWLSAKFTGLVALFLLAIGSIVPYLVCYLIFFGSPSDSQRTAIFLLGNPFAMDFTSGFRAVFLIFAGGWALVIALLNLSWFHRGIAGFRPPEEKIEMEPALSESR
jgi:hypothetical protein